MTRPYRGESCDEWLGITCPDDVRSSGNTIPKAWRKHDGGCGCFACMKQGINGWADAESGQFGVGA